MFVELHMIQNFAPANLNRDDTNAPKDCDFGGYRRARISSQCIKRAIRWDPAFGQLLESYGAFRTRRLILEISKRIDGEDPPSAETVKLVAQVFNEGGIERPKVKRGEEAEKDHTKLILFLSRSGVDQMVQLFKDTWEPLTKGNKQARKVLIDQLGETLADAVRSPDIAMFGRMVEIGANKPFGKKHLNIDAACQVAHAISTNKAEMEFDFYTAVDDLQPQEEAGAGMMGTIEFNSSCFYRYANIDFEQLVKNLQGDVELARKSVEAFLRAAIAAVPTGKQNSMAAQNPPSFVLAVVRPHGLWSLANAFVKPVWPDAQKDLIQKSIEALDQYWGRLTSAYYGTGNGAAAPKALFFKVHDADLPHLKDRDLDKESLDELVKAVIARLPLAKEPKA
jgi:CRISPR system Cascade subunit CasC